MVRKWQDQAIDDPNGYYDVAGVQPTPIGTYETHSALRTSGATATAGQAVYSFRAQGVTVFAEWLVTTSKIYAVSGSTLTDKTNGVTVGTYPYMGQYGDVTVCAMGSGNPTVSSSAGGNFSAIAGAPKAEIVVVQSNCVVAFNTDAAADGWAASDVGDYTNWTTGEAASGRILATPGWVTAAVPFGNDIIVFKPSAIYRMTYVGGLVKWSIQLVWSGIGCTISTNGTAQNYSKYYARQGLDTILFFGQGDSPIFTSSTRQTTSYAYLFDGSSGPRCVNPVTTVTEGAVLHDTARDTFTVVPVDSAVMTGGISNPFFSPAYFYNRRSDMWGRMATSGVFSPSSTHNPIPVTGAYYVRQTKSPMPNWWGDTGGNLIKYTTSTATTDAAFTSYVETAKIGDDRRKTFFSRVIPAFWRKNGGIDGSLNHHYGSCTGTFFVERYNTASDVTTTTKTQTQSAATTRDRFDILQEAGWARFKVTWQNTDAELADVQIVSKPGGED